MKRAVFTLLALLALALPARAQGTIPIALSQQLSSTGQLLIGCQLYIFQVGTVATPQNAFQDTGLTIALPNPMSCDGNGRLPMFYLANGSVHVRLTDANGVVQFDYPSMLVVGPSGGGGGGGSVDPTTILSTGDVKFRPTNEVLTGWVRLNGQSIGSATSGATGRANADTQNLYVYLWTNCTNTHCPVNGGRGASGLADFSANKRMTLPDWRGRGPMGLDNMGSSALGLLSSINMTGAGDTTVTPGGIGGQSIHTMTLAELVAHNHLAAVSIVDPGHFHVQNNLTAYFTANPAGLIAGGTAVNVAPGTTTAVATTGITANASIGTTGSSAAFNVMSPFILGSFHMKL